MSDKIQTFTDAIGYWFGSGASSLIIAVCARLAFHGSEARNQRRKFFGPELLYELPSAVALAMFAEAVAAYFGIDPAVRPAVVGGLAYLGPRGIEALFQRWVTTKLPVDPK